MSQHWNELYAQTQDLSGTAANLFIQQISDKIRIEGETLAINGNFCPIWAGNYLRTSERRD